MKLELHLTDESGELNEALKAKLAGAVRALEALDKQLHHRRRELEASRGERLHGLVVVQVPARFD